MQRTFALPRSLADKGEVILEVHVGPLAPGQRVHVTTAAGELIGAISPFGAAARERPGIYSLPVPRDAIHDGTLSTRITITDANKPPRAPTAAEVTGLDVRAPNASP